MDAVCQSLSSKRQKPCKEQKGSEDEDIISKLPDSVLHYILTFLPTKDTIRTAILSTRWQHLWTSISNIDLEDMLSWHGESTVDRPMPRTCLSGFVDRVLLLRDASDIKRFRLTLFEHVDSSRINTWVSTAVKRKVQELDLTLPLRERYVLPCCLFTCKSLAVLKLKMDCDLKVPTFICFPSLKSLHLSQVNLSDDNSTQRLFSSCPVLQELVLKDCRLTNVNRITISIPTLRSLAFQNNWSLLDCEIKIYAASLVSLKYVSDTTVDWCLCFLGDLSSLVHAYVDLWNNEARQQDSAHHAIRLLNSIRNAKSLTISNGTLMSLSCAENLIAQLPTFYNLTYLEVVCEMSDCTTTVLFGFLEKLPNLQFLDISKVHSRHPKGFDTEFDFKKDDCVLELVPCCFKSHLKTFRISGFDGKEVEIHLLKFMLKNATVLERITIYCLDDFVTEQEKAFYQLQMLPRGSESCVIELL